MMQTVVALLVVAALLVGAPPASRAASDGCPEPARLPPSPLQDLAGSPHRGSVVCAAWYDLVRGTTRDTFHPHRPVRRDQMASVLARMLARTGQPLPSRPPMPFVDVGRSVHRDTIALVAARGLVAGTRHGRFRPLAPARRGDVAAWLVRLAATVDVSAAAAPDAFPDDDGTPREDAINEAAALGLVRGRADGTFGADGWVRRDQAASIVARAIRLLIARGVVDERPVPAFAARRTAIPAAMRRRMRGATWREGCPTSPRDLVLLRLAYWDYAAEPRRGHLIVARAVASDVTAVFARLYAARFQIDRMRPVHTFPRGEAGSLGANNTSAFNCRATTGGGGWSQHSYGTAIDINPRQNPYVDGARVLPARGRPWVPRAPVRRGMIAPDGPVVAAFDDIGWGWGGRWRRLKDYQHFSATGR